MNPSAETRALAARLGVSADVLARLERWADAFAAANRGINLASYGSPEDLWRLHLLDSLAPLLDPAFDRPGARAIDVGAGGGFPGIPWALARPDWSITLLDSVQKKLRALEESPGRPPNIRFHAGRAEEAGREASLRESFDVAFCRAVGPLPVVLELTLPFVRVGGFGVYHRGAEAALDLESSSRALTLLGGKPGAVTPYEIPGLDRRRHIVRIDKVAPTPEAYPRRVGVPEKRPL